MNVTIIISKIRFHLSGLLISLLIGAIITLPAIFFRFSTSYQGIDMMKTNTETHYIAQIKEVMDGHYGLGNPFYADLKDSPYLFPPLSPLLIGLVGKLFSLDIYTIVSVARFVSTGMTAFFIYLFVALLTSRRLVGIIAAPAVMLGYGLLDPHSIINLFVHGVPTPTSAFIDYGRPINPQMSSLFFFAYLFFLQNFLTKNKLVHGIIASVLLGLSFYVYLFTWTFIIILNGTLGLVYIFRKEWPMLRGLVYISLGGLLVGIPYFLNVYQASLSPWYEESAARFGFVNVRFLTISRIVIGTSILFGLVYKWCTKEIRIFFIAFFLAAFVAVNEQLVTGKYLFNHHYHWYYITPLIIVCILVVLFVIMKKLNVQRKFQLGIGILLSVVTVSNGILAQAYSFYAALPETTELQKYAPVVSWLNTETEKDSSVLAPGVLSDLLPAITHNNVYYPNTGLYTLISNERLLNIYLVYTYLDQIPKERIREHLESKRDEISGFAFGYTYSFIPGVCYGCFPDSIIDSLVKVYEGLDEENFIFFATQYPVDYIIWDTQKNPEWNIDRFNFSLVKQFGSIKMYKL